MRILYLGTGAADWTPQAGARDGISRRFTCALVDRALLIDLAPTTPRALFAPGAALGGVTDILYTHSHDDHYDEETLFALCREHPVRVWAETSFAARIPAHPQVEVHPLRPGERVSVGNYTVLPLWANHRVRTHPEEQPLHYVISDGQRRLFWGADGAWLPCDTWRHLRAEAPFDRMVLDGTLGEAQGDPRIFEHNNLPMVRQMAETFRRARLLTPGGQIWLTHLSRDSHESPLTLGERLRAEGLYVAQDDTEDSFS